MTTQEQRVLAAVRATPTATQQELAERIGMSREAIAGHIMRLTRKGYILGKGYIFPEADSIVVIGAANVDLSGNSQSAFLAGDSNPGSIHQSIGGVGRNIAENLARLGNDTTLVAAIGKDSSGQWLREQCINAGINTDYFHVSDQHATGRYIALNNHLGELQAALADMQVVDSLSPSYLQDQIKIVKAAQTLVLDANISSQTLLWLAQQNLDASLMADAVSANKAPKLKPILSKLQVLKVNQSEAQAILESDESSVEVLAQLLLKCGVKQVLLSLGNQGVLYCDAKQLFISPVKASKPVSDTGAGDSLLAGFIHARKLKPALDIQQQLSFALHCAALTLESEFAVNPTLDEQAIMSQLSH
ncbi:winged helix-turn-helix transcriptional regulator [Alginatibacterium sediminis]|uniref:Winged helix-turn-helix transcriptional regulator n=1 Tax=Alginatibacterium sediminis TaxID=2164068 RepID=A0A420E933_9ALTE|nr:carbohydrate kinase [Alginatibacterium sediminis]RKF15602.1 winged helix-turn-helix transcriptional regulator [Alginatibacterium sediminis]